MITAKLFFSKTHLKRLLNFYVFYSFSRFFFVLS